MQEPKVTEDSSEFSKEEAGLYLQAIDRYDEALAVLGQRKKKNSAIFDTVSWELSTTHYTLASQLQDFAPLSRKSTPDVVRDIVYHYSKSLKYCETKTEDENRLPILQYRSASIYARLAALYHYCHRAATPETSGKPSQHHHFRQMAESNYERAAALYSIVEDHGEFLRCLLEQISLQEFQMEESHPNKRNFFNIISLFVQALPTLKALTAKVQVKVSSKNIYYTKIYIYTMSTYVNNR